MCYFMRSCIPWIKNRHNHLCNGNEVMCNEVHLKIVKTVVCGYLQLPLELLIFFSDKDTVNFCTEYMSKYNGHWAQMGDFPRNSWEIVFSRLRCVSFLGTASSESLHYLAVKNDSHLERAHNIIPHLWLLRFLWNSGLIALDIRTLNLLPVMCTSGVSSPCC